MDWHLKQKHILSINNLVGLSSKANSLLFPYRENECDFYFQNMTFALYWKYMDSIHIVCHPWMKCRVRLMNI